MARALEKAKEDRYPTVEAFAQAARKSLETEAHRNLEPTQALHIDLPREPRIRFGRHAPVLPPADDFDDDDAFGDEGDDEFDSGTSLGRRAWQLGGRAARRSRPFHRTIWRLAMVFAIGNMLLGSVLLVRDGPESLVERFLSVVPGTTTEVSVDELNLRTGPGADEPVIAVLTMGDEVEVTGLSSIDSQGRWWPVDAEKDGQQYSGWVWEGGLTPNEWTGRMSFMQDVVNQVQATRNGVSNAVDTMSGWWPF